MISTLDVQVAMDRSGSVDVAVPRGDDQYITVTRWRGLGC